MSASLLIRPPEAAPGVHCSGSAYMVELVTAADVTALAEASRASWSGGTESLSSAEVRDEVEPAFSGEYGPMIPDASLLVRADGRVVGAVLTVRHVPGSAAPEGPYVIDLFVIPEYRRQGIGRQLLTAAIAAVGAEPIALRVEPDDSAALALCADLGFSPARLVLVAPDKFKGTLTADQAATVIRGGVRRALPLADIRTLPFADGGEGTVEAVAAAGGELHREIVTGPLGEPVDASWARLGDTAVIEMAQASGLQLVTPTPATSLVSDTAGTGELMLRALDAGATRLVIGIGGSASTDGGTGALRTLGARFLDRSGDPVATVGAGLSTIASVDLSGLDPRLLTTELVLCTDVSNPFVGPSGAAAVFGPQKGADATAVAELDAGLTTLAAALATATGVDLVGLGWGGAGGGIAGGFRAALGARAESGVDVIAELLELDRHLDGVDLVVVGEGSIDEQSAMGKTPVGVARRALTRGIPSIAVVGVSALGSSDLAGDGILSITAAVDIAPSPADALADPQRWVGAAAEHAVNGIRESLR